MKTVRRLGFPALFIAWYVALSGSTIGFIDAALTPVRPSLEAPLEIIVPETRARRSLCDTHAQGSLPALARPMGQQREDERAKGHAPTRPGQPKT